MISIGAARHTKSMKRSNRFHGGMFLLVRSPRGPKEIHGRVTPPPHINVCHS